MGIVLDTIFLAQIVFCLEKSVIEKGFKHLKGKTGCLMFTLLVITIKKIKKFLICNMSTIVNNSFIYRIYTLETHFYRIRGKDSLNLTE